MQASSMKHLKTGLVAVAATAFLAACGGSSNAGTSVFDGGTSGSSSSSGSSTSTTTTSPTMKVSLSSTTVTSAAPVTVTVKLTTSAGKALAAQVVAFTTANSLGAFSATSALTDATGTATVTLTPASGVTTGADTLTATATVDGTAVSASTGFQLTSASVKVTSLTSDLSGALSAYGQTNLTAVLSGVSSSTPATVTFTSACVTAGYAAISPVSTTNTTGTVTAVYKDKGCGAYHTSDTIQAAVTGSSSTASTTVSLTSPAVNSITFSSASPSTIYLKGSGYAESSTVTFKVVDLSGNALPNQKVTLALTTTAGGITMDGSSDAETKTSDSNGLVTAVVDAGTVPTPVRVTATLGSIETVSSDLAIAVGLPTQQRFSLSQETKNMEGGNIDGTQNTYTVIASDRVGNPVPVGTAINFITESGQITTSAKTILDTNGISSASVKAVTADPRPVDGRVTVLAYALGEESFIDLHGTNVYQADDPFQDLGNIYEDDNFDGTHESTEQFFALGTSNHITCASIPAAYQTLLSDANIPSVPDTCDGVWGKAYVRRDTQTVWSTSTSRPLWVTTTGVTAGGTVDLLYTDSTTGGSSTSTEQYSLVDGSSVEVTAASGTFRMVIADANSVRLNPMAAGTTVTASGTTGLTVTVLAGGTVPSTTEATSALISYSLDTSTATSGTITVTTTSPSGLQSSALFDIAYSSS